MKSLFSRILAVLSLYFFAANSVSLAQAPKAVDEDPEFVEARSLFWSGQYEEAEKKLKVYLGSHPEHAPTRDFLKMILQSRKYNPQQIELAKKYLEGIRVEKFEVKNLGWRSVCARFETLANPTKNGKPPANYVNFINLLPTKFQKEVTLDLKNVSLFKAIELAAEQAELRLVVDTWAVIFDLPETK